MHLTLAFLMLVTMVTAINLRKQYRPVNDDRKEVANKLMNLFINIENKRVQLPLATGTSRSQTTVSCLTVSIKPKDSQKEKQREKQTYK